MVTPAKRPTFSALVDWHYLIAEFHTKLLATSMHSTKPTVVCTIHDLCFSVIFRVVVALTTNRRYAQRPGFTR